MEVNDVRGRFEQFQWHDSEIRTIEVRRLDDRRFVVVLDVVIGFKGERHVILRRFRFDDCWTFKTDIDLAFMVPSDGSVCTATYEDEFEALDESVKGAFRRVLYEQQQLVPHNGWFYIELLPPGGMILIGAENFAVEIV